MSWKNAKEIPILLVEDDEDDVCLIERAFKKGKILNRCYVVRDGQEAMEFLTHSGRYAAGAEAPKPGLILLDLNMPIMNGWEVLERVKNDPDLHRIPIIVLTTSDQEKDILKSYDRGANSYITKPVQFDKFLNVVIMLGKYWLGIAEVPDGDEAMQPGFCSAGTQKETS